MNKIFLEIYLFMLCINAGIMIVESTPTGTPLDIPLISPMDAASNVTSTAMPTSSQGGPIFQVNHCVVAGEIDYSLSQSECTTASGTWTVVSGSLINTDNQSGGSLSTPVNGTGSSTILDPIQDAVFFPFALFELFVNFITGGFIWALFATFGFPSIFVTVMQVVIGMLLAVTIVYYFTGR